MYNIKNVIHVPPLGRQCGEVVALSRALSSCACTRSSLSSVQRASTETRWSIRRGLSIVRVVGSLCLMMVISMVVMSYHIILQHMIDEHQSCVMRYSRRNKIMTV